MNTIYLKKKHKQALKSLRHMIQQTNISKPWNRPDNNENYGKAFNSDVNNSKMEHILNGMACA